MIWKIIKLSLKAIWNNKLRSALTMLGIIIGVMAVVILVSITQGATEGITDSIADMGSDRITASITDSDVSLSVETVQELLDYGMIDSVAPVVSVDGSVKKGSTTGNYSVYGITPSYFTVQDVDIQRGRKLVDSDIEWTTGVCVIGRRLPPICLALGMLWMVRSPSVNAFTKWWAFWKSRDPI